MLGSLHMETLQCMFTNCWNTPRAFMLQHGV
nr:MAG TPA: hypothetical protein [Caudoviricetes sp.]